MKPTILPLVLENVVWEADGQRLIDGISLTLEAGPRTVVLGPNGSGKSLLLRLCHGLIGPTRGSVRWTGPASREARRRQAMAFQRPVMLRRPVLANVEYGLRLRGLDRASRTRRAEEVLERTGLLALARRPARVLSGGEQQRLALARAWALRPDVLFLDEPTASLDPAGVAAVEAIINDIHRSGTRLVLTTQDLGQARRLADEVVFLDRGRVTDFLPADTFFTGPVSEPAAAFLAGLLPQPVTGDTR